MGLLDGVARALFAMWQGYAPAQGVTALLWLFLVVEVSFGIVQLAPWWRVRRAIPAGIDHTSPHGS